jgi:hypothetical protein
MLQAEGGFGGARAICALRPTYFQLGARARSFALYGVHHCLWSSPGKVVCVIEALVLGVLGVRGPLGC